MKDNDVVSDVEAQITNDNEENFDDDNFKTKNEAQMILTQLLKDFHPTGFIGSSSMSWNTRAFFLKKCTLMITYDTTKHLFF